MKKYYIKRDNLILAELDPTANYLLIVDETKVDNLENFRCPKGMTIQVLFVMGDPRKAVSFVKIPKKEKGLKTND
ncbi:hypothetical protein HZB78_05480 [Candidatus Collierbacteria bacterium]|nr:hypothetical protein [Candidatus Collierbacteria bacterium]